MSRAQPVLEPSSQYIATSEIAPAYTLNGFIFCFV